MYLGNFRVAQKNQSCSKFSASILCEGHIYNDFRNINFYNFLHVLEVPQGGSTLKKMDFQVTSIALLLGV